MSLTTYAAYLLACLIVVLVPGPTVTLILANSIRHGTRAGLTNVLGTQVGLALMIGVVGLGLTSLMEAGEGELDSTAIMLALERLSRP